MYVRQNKNQLAIAHNGYAGFGGTAQQRAEQEAQIAASRGMTVEQLRAERAAGAAGATTPKTATAAELAERQKQKDAALAARGGTAESLDDKLARLASRSAPAPAPSPAPAPDNTTKYLIAGGIATALILGVLLLKK